MADAQQVQRWAAVEPAVRQTQLEADNAGATLHYDGEGGIEAGLALHVFRRDGWACRLCGTSEDLELDHLGGHPDVTPFVVDQGLEHEDTAENLVTVCHNCQDILHDADRELNGQKERK